MARRDGHSRLVKWAKVVLPLAALILLSMTFLISDRIDPKKAPFYSDVSIQELARQARIGAPQYASVADDGSTVMVRASTAFPGTGNIGTTAQDIVAKLDSPDGLVTDLTARSGRFDPSNGPIHLFDGVAMQTSTGYTMQTSATDMSPDRAIITAPNHVTGTSPFGPFEADWMQLTRPAPGAPYDLVFKGNVKLVYQPK